MNNDIAYKIKDIRTLNNLSQKGFARRIGVSPQAVSSYETGRVTPPLKVLEKISSVYNQPSLIITRDIKSILNEKMQKIEVELRQIRELLY